MMQRHHARGQVLVIVWGAMILYLLIVTFTKAACLLEEQAFVGLSSRPRMSLGTVLHAFDAPLEHAPWEDDPYKVLGVDISASHTDIKTQFHKLVRLYHPDIGASGSGELLQRVLDASREVLQNLEEGSGEKYTSTPEPHGQRMSRYDRQKAKKAKRGQDLDEVVLYSGRGRLKRGLWATYRISLAGIRISWSFPTHAVGKGAKPQRMVRFRDLRKVAGLVDLKDGRCDVNLEFLWGKLLVLEQIPRDVVSQVEKLVEAAAKRREALHENMLRRCA